MPFLSLLAPSERYYASKARAHKNVLDWTRQALRQVRRWLPERRLVFVGDSSYAAIDLLWRMTQLANPITMVVRFRIDAALYEPAPPAARAERAAAQERQPLAYPGAASRPMRRPPGNAAWYLTGMVKGGV